PPVAQTPPDDGHRRLRQGRHRRPRGGGGTRHRLVAAGATQHECAPFGVVGPTGGGGRRFLPVRCGPRACTETGAAPQVASPTSASGQGDVNTPGESTRAPVRLAGFVTQVFPG